MITTEKFIAVAENDSKDYRFGQFIDVLDFTTTMLDRGINVRIMRANGSKSKQKQHQTLI